MRLEPFDHLDAAVAEVAQRRAIDSVADFHAEVFVHRFGRIVVAGGFLKSRTAARIYDAAALCARAAAAKAVGYDDVGARSRSFDSCAGSGGAEADHQHIAMIVPCDGLLAVGAERRTDWGGSRIARVDRCIGSDAGG